MSQDNKDKTGSSPTRTFGYIDAHLHLADPAYAGKINEVIDDATRHNVGQMLSNATDYQSSLATINLAKAFPEQILAAIGVHPSAMLQSKKVHLEEFDRMIDENSAWISAIGEIGLDGKYTQDERIRSKQLEVFRFFLGLAEETQLPVVVHSRQAVAETLRALSDFHLSQILLHWYDGPIENLATIKEKGQFISIGPALLYSRRIQEIARVADPSVILSETDGPVPYRGLFDGKLTVPSFVLDVIQKLAEMKESTPEIMRSAIHSNFRRFMHP